MQAGGFHGFSPHEVSLQQQRTLDGTFTETKSNTLAAQKQWLLPHNRRLGDVLETNTNDAACQRACAVCVCHNMYNQFIPHFTLVPLDNCIN